MVWYMYRRLAIFNYIINTVYEISMKHEYHPFPGLGKSDTEVLLHVISRVQWCVFTHTYLTPLSNVAYFTQKSFTIEQGNTSHMQIHTFK